MSRVIRAAALVFSDTYALFFDMVQSSTGLDAGPPPTFYETAARIRSELEERLASTG